MPDNLYEVLYGRNSALFDFLDVCVPASELAFALISHMAMHCYQESHDPKDYEFKDIGWNVNAIQVSVYHKGVLTHPNPKKYKLGWPETYHRTKRYTQGQFLVRCPSALTMLQRLMEIFKAYAEQGKFSVEDFLFPAPVWTKTGKIVIEVHRKQERRIVCPS